MTNFTNREEVMHRFAGAAYNLTFMEEYQLAAEVMQIASEFSERHYDTDTEDGPRVISVDELEEISKAEADPIPPEAVNLPSPGTLLRECLACILNHHNAGEEWVNTKDIREVAANPKSAHVLSNLSYDYPYVESKEVDGNANEYRVKPGMRDVLREGLVLQNKPEAEA